MAIILNRLGNRAVEIITTVGAVSSAEYFTSVSNVFIGSYKDRTGVDFINVTLKQDHIVQIKFSDITTINGVAKPTLLADTVKLLATDVFSIGGDNGTGVVASSSDTFSVMSSNVWDRSLYGNVQRSLSSNETLSITNDTAAFSFGVMYVTPNGYTLTLPGQSTGLIFNQTGETTLVYNKRAGVYRWSSNGVLPPLSAPVITTQPTGSSVSSGSVMTLSVDYTGYPTATVQWQKSTDGGTSFTNITGATAKTYSKSSVVTGDSGKYKAVITNSQGTVTSSVVDITVSAASTTPTLMTVASSIGVDTSSPSDFRATDQVNADDINPMIFAQTLSSGADGSIMFSINSSSGNDLTIDTRNVYFGFSEIGTYIDPANVYLNMKVGLFREFATGKMVVKDNDGFYGQYYDVAAARITTNYSSDGRRIGIKRTGNVYTVIQSNDYGVTFFPIYTFTNYSYTGKLYVMAGIIDGGFPSNSSLAYPLQIGLI